MYHKVQNDIICIYLHYINHYLFNNPARFNLDTHLLQKISNMIRKSLLYFSVDRALALYQQHELMRAREEEDRVIRAFSAERNYG